MGVYSVCSANRFVLEAAMMQAKADGAALLIEATSNQVDQFGGYTGMTPARFVEYIKNIAESLDFPFEKIILGGDHLGPNAWQDHPAGVAMKNARQLVCDYVSAGFVKIHLDTSMRCADDPGAMHTPLDPAIIVKRAVELCKISETAFSESGRLANPPLYVIGTEVPPPGGAREALNDLAVTTVDDARMTIEMTRLAFLKNGLQSAWERVIAIVVQPGVEFGDDAVVDYSRRKAGALSALIEQYDALIYEAHSTDYQTGEALRQMVEDHFAILKVGPWLTFALREAVFALANIETEWLSSKKNARLSNIREALENAMLAKPEYWQKHYHGNDAGLTFARKYSYSDRIRYYWPTPAVRDALTRLLVNLSGNPLPMTLLSQFMPRQYHAVRAGRITCHPLDLIRHKIMEVTGIYAKATKNKAIAIETIA